MILRRRNLALLLATFVCALGCATKTAPPPVLLISVNGLRADALGPRLTPNLHALTASASWSGRAISTSSDNAPALASVLTGLRPWQHQVLLDGGVLARRYITIAQALGTLGYHTAGFAHQRNLRRANGLARGFDAFDGDSNIERICREIARTDAAPTLIWAHLDPLREGYRRLDRFLPRLEGAPRDLPEQVTPIDIERWFDLAKPMPAGVRAQFWALYQTDIALVDEQVGDLLKALRDSGRFDDTLIAVVSTHGEDFGEHGQSSHGGSLGRALIEVPLILKLPRAKNRETSALVIPATERVSIARLFATILKAAGGEPPPGVAPHLGIRDPAGAISELYAKNGVNSSSLVVGDLQLERSVRFAEADPDYYRARLAVIGVDASPALSKPAQLILTQALKPFRQRLPWRGNGDSPTLRIQRWLVDGGIETIQDPLLERRLLAQIERGYFAFVPEELTARESLRRR
ncbi:MAG: sulfatase-like hydrolase/transferase [Acidobacteriota bacterium]